MSPEKEIITNRVAFGRLLSQRLAAKNLTPKEASSQLNGEDDSCHISSAVLYDYMVGKTFPTKKRRLMSLCEFLGINWQRLDLTSLVNEKYWSDYGLTLEDGTIIDQIRGLSKRFEGYPTGNETKKRNWIVGKSGAMGAVFEQLENIIQASDQEPPVLITGETGVGKELVAHAIHHQSYRKKFPFKAVNITNIRGTLLESQLFGHLKGAFTGATGDKQGFFEVVDQGTLFLDEISSLPPHTQVRLLRAIEDRTFFRVGCTETLDFNGRVITTTTNQDLKILEQRGEFRPDFRYRLDIARVDIPPLRERKEDIPLLYAYIIAEHNLSHQTSYSE